MEAITCAFCGAEFKNCILPRPYFGFYFCNPQIENGFAWYSCYQQFNDKLWQAAAEARDKANEEARLIQEAQARQARFPVQG